MLEELCYADDPHDTAEQQNDEAVDEMDAMYEGPAEAVPAQDQDMTEEEQQRPEPMQQARVLPSVNPAGVRDDLVGAQGTPKALASTLVCQQDLLVLAIWLLAQPCLESSANCVYNSLGVIRLQHAAPVHLHSSSGLFFASLLHACIWYSTSPMLQHSLIAASFWPHIRHQHLVLW